MACTARRQEAAKLHWLSGVMQQDAAERMGIKLPAVSRLLGQALDRIVAELSKPPE